MEYLNTEKLVAIGAGGVAIIGNTYAYLFYFLIKTIDLNIVIKMTQSFRLVNILYITYIDYLYEITNYLV